MEDSTDRENPHRPGIFIIWCAWVVLFLNIVWIAAIFLALKIPPVFKLLVVAGIAAMFFVYRTNRQSLVKHRIKQLYGRMVVMPTPGKLSTDEKFLFGFLVVFIAGLLFGLKVGIALMLCYGVAYGVWRFHRSMMIEATGQTDPMKWSNKSLLDGFSNRKDAEKIAAVQLVAETIAELKRCAN